MSEKLRIMTYLVPGLPLGLFQTYQYYLEEALGIKATLTVESRWNCPPPDRNPIKDNEADLVFMCSSGLLSALATKGASSNFELLPVAPIHRHEKSELRPVYFSELITQKHRSDTYKEFVDLKGAKFITNNEDSLSGNIIVLSELKRQGYNATFFGHTLESGSHHASIEMVVQGRGDVAAIDSNVLAMYLKEHPETSKEIHVISSLGPLPIYPVVVNPNLAAETKEKLTAALLSMNKIEKWKLELEKYFMWGFKPGSMALYEEESQLREACKNLHIQPAYY